MQPAGLRAQARAFDDEVGDGDEVAQLAQLGAHLRALVEGLRLLVNEVYAARGALQAQVGAHNAHVVAHDVLHLVYIVRDEYPLFRAAGTTRLPVGDVGLQLVLGQRYGAGLPRRVGIHQGL